MPPAPLPATRGATRASAFVEAALRAAVRRLAVLAVAGLAGLAGLSLPASADVVSRAAREALAKVLPDGYRTAAVVPCPLDGHERNRFVAVLVDAGIEAPERTVRLLYLAWSGTWQVLDALEIAGRDADSAPQYLDGADVVRVGEGRLLFVHTNWSRGGSGSPNYFQFYAVRDGRLRLLRTFEHERMERGLHCLRNERIYDATIACARGARVGRSYVHACALETTEFTFDGRDVRPVRTERLEERTGNRFLDESYWNMSLAAVLGRGGSFPPLR